MSLSDAAALMPFDDRLLPDNSLVVSVGWRCPRRLGTSTGSLSSAESDTLRNRAIVR